MIRQAMKQNEPISIEGNIFPRYFIINFPRINIDTELDSIRAQREISNQIGEYDAKIKKQGSSTLLIKVKSKQQGDRLRQIN